MRRREFIAGLGSTAAWPIVARAQQPALPVVGYLSGWSPGDAINYVTSFRQGLAETGYIEGQNVAIEYRWAEDHFDSGYHSVSACRQSGDPNNPDRFYYRFRSGRDWPRLEP